MQRFLCVQGIPIVSLPPSSLSLSYCIPPSLPHALGLDLFDLHLFSRTFFFFLALLARSPSRDSEAILSWMVTRQYCDGVPEGNLSDFTVRSFSSTEEAGVCLAEPNNSIFHFQNGYQHQAQRDFQSGRESSSLVAPYPRKMLIFWKNEV